MNNFFKVEKYNASDDDFKLVELYVECGEFVNEGDVLFSIETSKASIDIVAEISGYLFFKKLLNSTLVVGELFYIISNDKNLIYDNFFVQKTPDFNVGITVSRKASDLLLKFNLNPHDLNLSIIRETDVLDYLNKLKAPVVYLIPSFFKEFIKDNSVLIFGAGHGNISACNTFASSKEFLPFGFVDYSLEFGFELFNNLPIFGFNQLKEIFDLGCKYIFINVPFNVLEKHLKEINEIGFVLVNCIHETASVASNAKIGSSVFIAAHAVVDEFATISDFALVGNNATLGCRAFLGYNSFILNNASVAHDSIIGKASIISDGARIAGRVSIGDNTLIGLNSTVNMDLNVGNNCTVFSGANVFNNLADNIVFKFNNNF